jgi:hypothetical protein
MRFLSSRLEERALRFVVALANSTQQGMNAARQQRHDRDSANTAVLAFRRFLTE